MKQSVCGGRISTFPEKVGICIAEAGETTCGENGMYNLFEEEDAEEFSAVSVNRTFPPKSVAQFSALLKQVL